MSQGSMFANKITKKIDNNEESCYVKNGDALDNIDTRTVSQKINGIFNSRNYIYKASVLITTNSGILEKTVIGKNNKYLITNSNEHILISDIIDIKQKNSN